MPIDQLMFSTTNYTPNAADRSKVSRAVLEGMALAIRANVEQLTEISGLKPSRLHISGGISQAAVFNEIVSDALSLPVVNPKYSEASALGAVICASMALGGYAALADASASLAENKPEISCCGGMDKLLGGVLVLYQPVKGKKSVLSSAYIAAPRPICF